MQHLNVRQYIVLNHDNVVMLVNYQALYKIISQLII